MIHGLLLKLAQGRTTARVTVVGQESNRGRCQEAGDAAAGHPADAYFHSLTPVDLIDVELAEMIHTLYSPMPRR